MNRHLVWLVLVSCWALIARAADVADADYHLTVRIVGPKGSPAEGSITVWRAVEEPQIAKRAAGFQPEEIWREKGTGKTWRPVRSSGAGKQETITGLNAGEYRVSAALRSAMTPFGVSDVIRLNESSRSASVVVKIAAGSQVSLNAVAEDTGKPVTWFQALVRRDDGFPVTRWSSSPWAPWSRQDDGLLVFDQLPPGSYSIEAGARAWNYGDKEYVSAGEIPLQVESRKLQRVLVPLQPRELSDEEVRERWPFSVTGKITDSQGRGLGGVRIMAHCGVGTLFPTGETQSGADGSYSLRFRPGVLSRDGTPFQAATIHPSKSGYAEQDLHRKGNLMMSDELPGVEGLQIWHAKTNQVVLRDRPYRLDFVMVPAGRFEGRLMGQDRRPKANERIELDGNELPPSSSILAASKTDGEGKFAFDNVPLKHEWWFVLPDKKDARSIAVRLEGASTQTYELTLRRTGTTHSLDLREE